MTSESPKIVRVGSRKSQLALVQSEYVCSLLTEHYPDTKFELGKLNLSGDVNEIDVGGDHVPF